MITGAATVPPRWASSKRLVTRRRLRLAFEEVRFWVLLDVGAVVRAFTSSVYSIDPPSTQSIGSS
jgi:hypothetical protein